MVSSKAATLKEYLAGLPPDRRAVIQAVREVILKNLDPDYEEGMRYGMIGYFVPHRIYPAGYHVDPRQPIGIAALSAQKNYCALYLGMPYYGYGVVSPRPTPDHDWFVGEWAKTGKKLDMGLCCVRFRKVEDLPLDLVGRAMARFPVKRLVQRYDAAKKKVSGAGKSTSRRRA
jgi:hypothetical protein